MNLVGERIDLLNIYVIMAAYFANAVLISPVELAGIVCYCIYLNVIAVASSSYDFMLYITVYLIFRTIT